MNISEILSTPYVLEIQSIENSSGEWVCLQLIPNYRIVLLSIKVLLRQLIN